MFLIELVVGFHQALHDVDEVAEDLHAAHAVEVRRAAELFLHGKGQVLREAAELRGGVALVGRHAGEVVAADLGAGLDYHAEVRLVGVVAADDVGHGRALGDGAVAVAELAVVVALEARVRVVVGDGEGVDDGVRGLYLRAQEVVKAVLVDALAGHGAAEAAEAAAAEGELPQIHHAALIGQRGAEVGYHVREVLVVRGAVRDDDHVLCRALRRLGQARA